MSLNDRIRADAGRLQAIFFQIIGVGSFEKGTFQRLGSDLQGLQGSITDATGRRIYHSLERLVVVGIDRKLQIGHHILHLGPLEE
jgi:hypothetical protein